MRGRRVDRPRKALLAAVAVGLVLVVAAALAVTWSGGDGGAAGTREDDRFVRPGAPGVAPSGAVTAYTEPGPEQDGVSTWVVVLRDRGGAEVFRDDYAYSDRHGVGVTWLSTADQLWVLSADVGDAHVDRVGTGWVKTVLTPGTVGDKPEEIRRLGR